MYFLSASFISECIFSNSSSDIFVLSYPPCTFYRLLSSRNVFFLIPLLIFLCLVRGVQDNNTYTGNDTVNALPTFATSLFELPYIFHGLISFPFELFPLLLLII